VVEPEHQKRIAVRQNPLVNRQLVARLVYALEHGNRVACGFAGNLLEAEGGAVKQLKRTGDTLKELRIASILAGLIETRSFQPSSPLITPPQAPRSPP